MKVRWNSNSLRLRITPSELARIFAEEVVGETLILTGAICWQVSIQPAAETRLSSEGQTAVLFLASNDRQRLAAPETEGVYFQMTDGLRFYVEKDFPCIHPRAAETLEPPTETFAAPPDFEQRKAEM